MGTEKDRFHRHNTIITWGFLMPPARQLTPGLLSSLGAWVPTVYLLGCREDHGIAFPSAACAACVHFLCLKSPQLVRKPPRWVI